MFDIRKLVFNLIVSPTCSLTIVRQLAGAYRCHHEHNHASNRCCRRHTKPSVQTPFDDGRRIVISHGTI
jgi:hypothetical protein